jgi:hypothetical protein
MAELDLKAPKSRRAATLGESGYDRIPLDFYRTPVWCTEALLSKVKFGRVIMEPACGDGAIVGVLRTAGHHVLASDIKDYGCLAQMRDFFSIGATAIDAIVANFPYEGSDKFIAHALWIAEHWAAKVAVLQRHEYDCAKQRRSLFADHPAFDRKITLTKRPRWSDSDKASPRFNFSWYVWDFCREPGPPQLEWAP